MAMDSDITLIGPRPPIAKRPRLDEGKKKGKSILQAHDPHGRLRETANRNEIKRDATVRLGNHTACAIPSLIISKMNPVKNVSNPLEVAAGQPRAVHGLGPLSRCLPAWKNCGATPWVLRTIAKGYKLQFSSTPPLGNKVIFSHASGEAAEILQAEITSLLQKNAIREVQKDECRLGFYSRYFLVKKKGGGVRPILDLRALNKYMKTFRFKMLTSAALMRMVRQDDWFTSADLKDAYQHIGIYAPHRKFLRFGFKGRIYEYLALPFGLSLSPRVFVKCTQAAMTPLRQQGLRVSAYIDDCLLFASSPLEASRHTEYFLNHMRSLGFTINREKSVLIPAQSIEFVGLTLDSVTLTARLCPDRVESFLACTRLFKEGAVLPFRTCMRMQGLMASAIHLTRLGRLYMKPFQRWVRALGIPCTRPSRRVVIKKRCVDALKWWSNRDVLSAGVDAGLVSSWKVITTDASLSGWGATHDGRSARGVWNAQLKTAHINYLELMAVFLALQRFEHLISGHHVLVRTDNTTTMCYVNKQGGLRSPRLHALARELTLWCHTRLASIRAVHVPGVLNRGADLLSRGGPRYTDWSLNPVVARQLWDRYGLPQADLFASEENAKLPLFFADREPAPLGVDALAYSWPRGLLYAFPPLGLIPHTLHRVRTQGLRMLLIAPAWSVWRSEIALLLFDTPWKLPLRWDLLSQAGGEVFHPHPEHLDLWVWPVRG